MKKLCVVEGCERTHWAKGLCSLHYQLMKRTGNTTHKVRLKKERKPKPVCKHPGCETIRHNKGYCRKHYNSIVLRIIPQKPGTYIRKSVPKQPCSIPNCDNVSKCLTLCNKHYLRLKNHGDPLVNYNRKYRRKKLIISNIMAPEKGYHLTREESELIAELYSENSSLQEKESLY